jgi:tetratricopeptide (TPR) repeat protein
MAGIAITSVLLLVAGYVSAVAAAAEQRLVQAARIALTIGRAPDPAAPRWDAAKAQMLQLVREGIQLNPHYRKITPIVADELARAGNWREAIPIWESVAASRPHIVAILSNMARGYMQLGELGKAEETLARARDVQRDAPVVRTLEVILAARNGRSEDALSLGEKAMAQGLYDFDMLTVVFILAANAHRDELAERAMLLRVANYPRNTADGLLKLGQIHARAGQSDKAIAYFRKALEAVPVDSRGQLLQAVPSPYREQLAQTSASKG